MTYSIFSPESLDEELSLTELRSMSGGVAPAAAAAGALLLTAAVVVAYLELYKLYKKEKEEVQQNGGDLSGSDDKNKLSYCGDVKKQEDPFGGTFTGKAN